MKKILLVTVLLVLFGCGTDSGHNGGQNVTIYINRGVIQCEPSGITPEESAKVLTNAGVDVISSSCGFMTGRAVLAVCGGGTLDIKNNWGQRTFIRASRVEIVL